MRKQVYLLLMIALLAGAGCARRPMPIQYNNVLAVNNFWLSESAKNFRTSLDPLSKDSPADPASVRGRYDAMVKELAKAKDEVAGNKPPRLSGKGWRLHYAYLEFLSGQEKILNNQFRQIVEVLEEDEQQRRRGGPARSPGAQWAIILPLLEEATEEEKKTREPLVEIQKGYARMYDSNLEQLPVTREKIKIGK